MHTHKTRPQLPDPKFAPQQPPRGDARFSVEELEKAMGPKVLTRPGR